MLASDKGVVVSGIGKSFGSVVALRDVSFEVDRGEVVALLGPNGAGKTTMVDILSTLTRPDHGRAVVAGHDVVSDPAGVRRAIMLTGQQVALDDMLTGRENLVMFGRLYGLGRSAARARAEVLLREFDLTDAASRRVSTYSGGMRRRIDIACGLVVRPEVVFLDEPTTGLDPRSRQNIWDLVGQFKTAGIATLLTTQYLEEADALSDRIVVIDHGTVIAEGTAVLWYAVRRRIRTRATVPTNAPTPLCRDAPIGAFAGFQGVRHLEPLNGSTGFQGVRHLEPLHW